MNEVKLDPKKLLGFRIIADGSVARLSSPKIGDKNCPSIEADATSSAIAAPGSLQVKEEG